MAKPESKWYDMAEQGWKDLIAAAEKIEEAANGLKKTEQSIDGYNIERALNKHKPDMMREHLAGLQGHRKENEL